MVDDLAGGGLPALLQPIQKPQQQLLQPQPVAVSRGINLDEILARKEQLGKPNSQPAQNLGTFDPTESAKRVNEIKGGLNPKTAKLFDDDEVETGNPDMFTSTSKNVRNFYFSHKVEK
jgi:hypothetical protein